MSAGLAGAGGIVFDLDGTLVDSVADIHAAVSALLAEEGLGALTLDQVRSFIGNGIPVLVERVMGARGLAAERHADLHTRFVAHYGSAPADLTRPYDDVEAALRTLSRRGYRLGVCTNKPYALAVEVLEACGLADHLGAVVGGDSVGVHKPDPRPLLTAQEALGVPCLYVGDSEVDAETAARAGLPFLFFRGGYCRVPVETLTFDHSFERFADLPELLALATPS